jgi:Zn-dependent protease
MDFLRNVDLGLLAIKYMVLLFSLSIHEASHAWMADRFGDYTARYLGRVTLNPIPHIDLIGTVLFPLLQFFFPYVPLIGWAKPVPINSLHLRNPRRDQIFISVAGPAANLCAGATAFIILVVLKIAWPDARGFVTNMAITMHVPPHSSIMAPVIGILFYAMIINIALALFNFIPIPPLDGHWILYGLLPSGAAAGLERMGSYGFLILYALMFTGVFQIIFTPITWIQTFLAFL